MGAGKSVCYSQDRSEASVDPQQSWSGTCPTVVQTARKLHSAPLLQSLLTSGLYWVQQATKWLVFWLQLGGAIWIWLVGVLELLTWGESRFVKSIPDWAPGRGPSVLLISQGGRSLIQSSSLGRPHPSWYVCLLNLTMFLITTKEKQDVLKTQKAIQPAVFNLWPE